MAKYPLRGRCIRIYVRIPLQTLVRTSITIGHYRKPICNESKGILCGRLSHTRLGCMYKSLIPTIDSFETHKEQKLINKWKTMTFDEKKDPLR